MINASSLRNPEELKKISSQPGYYKWWVSKTELHFILKTINVPFSEIENALETKDDFFCVYVGIAKKSLRQRLNWHVNDPHTAQRVESGRLSTLRQTIASLVSHNQYDKVSTDVFIDRMLIEYFYIDCQIKLDVVKTELHKIETSLMSEYLRILNIQDNHHSLSKLSKNKLKQLRKESKQINS